jgi:hypothetical protein
MSKCKNNKVKKQVKMEYPVRSRKSSTACHQKSQVITIHSICQHLRSWVILGDSICGIVEKEVLLDGIEQKRGE